MRLDRFPRTTPWLLGRARVLLRPVRRAADPRRGNARLGQHAEPAVARSPRVDQLGSCRPELDRRDLPAAVDPARRRGQPVRPSRAVDRRGRGRRRVPAEAARDHDPAAIPDRRRRGAARRARLQPAVRLHGDREPAGDHGTRVLRAGDLRRRAVQLVGEHAGRLPGGAHADARGALRHQCPAVRRRRCALGAVPAASPRRGRRALVPRTCWSSSTRRSPRSERSSRST